MLSSLEAKYMDLSITSSEVVWLNKLACNFVLKIKKMILIYCDNEGGIKMTINLDINPKTKHIATHYHFIRKKNKNKRN